jgi:hypothetical protein
MFSGYQRVGLPSCSNTCRPRGLDSPFSHPAQAGLFTAQYFNVLWSVGFDVRGIWKSGCRRLWTRLQHFYYLQRVHRVYRAGAYETIVCPDEARRLKAAASHRLVSCDISLLDKLCLSLLSQGFSLSAAWPSFSRRLERASPDQGQPADNDLCRGSEESRIGIGERCAEQFLIKRCLL